MTTGKRIFGAIVIAIALFFFWPVVFGQWSTISALRDAVAERTTLLGQRTAILANVRSAYQQYQQELTGDQGLKFAAFVPVKKSQAELISAIQAIASSVGVTASDVHMAELQGAADATYKTLSLSIDLSGSYGGMHQFLGSLESYVRLLNVDSIDVTTDSRTPGQLKFAIKAETYFLK